MKIAIIDDNALDRKTLADYISTYCEKHLTLFSVDTFESGEAFLLQKTDIETPYQIIFLDIYMTGIDGVSLAKQLRQMHMDGLIIFTTSSKDHAIESFRIRAFDYLVKPFEYTQLSETLDLCSKRLRNSSQYIQVKEGRSFVKILLNHIIYTDYSNHYIVIHTHQRIIKTYLPFDAFSALLSPYAQFLCCYRNCIINMDQVLKMEEKDFVMSSNERIPIAKNNKKQIKSLYSEYTFQKLK
ncbi:MAG: LytTR family DNA-binding domain-containing protein [Anaerovorax sp.]